jgi:hypothetical protein
MAVAMQVRPLVVNLSADTSRLKAGLAVAGRDVQTSAQKMGGDLSTIKGSLEVVAVKATQMGGALVPVVASVHALKEAETQRAAAAAAGLNETTRLLAQSRSAAEEAAESFASIALDTGKLIIPDESIRDINASFERINLSTLPDRITDEFRTGTSGAMAVVEGFVEAVKTKVMIAGIALATGVAIGALTAVYAAYKIASTTISFIEGLVTGDSYKSENIDALIALNDEVKKLQEDLNLTAVGASALNEALKKAGVDAATYTSTITGATAALRTNTDELDRLGVKYKDQAGNLLPVEEALQSAADVLETYAEGWDRQQAASAIGMGSLKQIQETLSVTAAKTQEAKDRLVDYGLIIGEGTQEAVERYETAMREFNRELDLTSQGFKKAIADNVMPLLTDLAEFFKDGFPTAVAAFRYSMATVTSLFYGLKTVAYMVSESILGSISAVGIGLGALATASMRVLKGDFTGAKDALVQGWTDAKTRLGAIGDNIVEQARRNAAAMRLAWGADSFGASSEPSKQPSTGKKWVPKPDKPDDPPKPGKPAAETLSEYEKLIRSINEKIAAQELESATEEKLTEGQKLAAKVMVGLRDGVLQFSDAEKIAVSTSLERLIAEEKANEARRASVMVQEEIDGYLEEGSVLRQDLARQLEIETLLTGKSSDAREIALAQLKSQTEAESLIAQIKKDVGSLTDEQIAQIRSEAAARGAVEQAVMGQIKAYGYINQLMGENRKAAAEFIADEQERAAALLQIDIEMWQERIALAGEGTEAQKALQEQFDQWYANRQLKPVVDKWRGVIEQLDNDFHEGFRDMLTGGESTWKAFAKSIGNSLKASLADALYQTFIQKYVVQIVASLAGYVSGPAVANALAGTSGGAGGVGQATSLLQAGKFLWDGFSSGFASVGATAGSAITQLGVATESAYLANFGIGMAGGGAGSSAAGVSAGAGAGAAVSAAAGVAAGVYGGRAISNGYSAIGSGSGNTAVNVGTAIGAIWGPIGAAIGGMIGGLVNRAFGMKEKEVESVKIRGNLFDGMMTDGSINTAWKQEGGWFRSDKSGVDTVAIDDVTKQRLIDGFAVVKNASLDFAKTLGIPAETISGYSKTIELQVSHNSDPAKAAEEDAAALTRMYGQMADELAVTLIPSLGQFMTTGETAGVTLERIVGNYKAVDSVLLTIGRTSKDAFGAVGVATIAARENLIKVAGSFDALASGTVFFAQNFMSEAERIAPIAKSVQETMAGLGYASVDTREEFKSLVLGLDLSTEAGARMYSQLLAVAPAFDQVATFAENAAQKAKELAGQGLTLDIEILRLQGRDSDALDLERQNERNNTDPSLWDKLDEKHRLEDVNSARAAAQATRQLEIDLMEAQGNAAGALAARRELEIAGMGAADAAIQRLIWSYQDQAAAADTVRNAQETAKANAQKAVDDAMDALQRSVKAERDRLTADHDAAMKAANDRLKEITDTAGDLKTLSDSLRSTVGRMLSSISSEASRAGAQAQIMSELAIARAGGPLPSSAALADALSIVSQPSEDLFGSFVDYQRDFLRTANAINELGDLTDGQLSIEEQSKKVLEQQLQELDDGFDAEIRRLDAALEFAQEEINVLRGIDASIVAIPAAIESLKSAIATAAGAASNSAFVEALYQNVLGRNPDAAGGAYWTGQLDSGSLTADQVAGEINAAKPVNDAVLAAYAMYTGKTADQVDDEGMQYWVGRANAIGVTGMQEEMMRLVRGYEDGTNYVQSDRYALIHEGERIMPAADNRELFTRLRSSPAEGGTALAAEVRSVKVEVGRLVAIVERVEKHAGNTADNTKRIREVEEAAISGNAAYSVEMTS